VLQVGANEAVLLLGSGVDGGVDAVGGGVVVVVAPFVLVAC
jgi:F0F1-type ATP synthase assembly protein I